MPQNKHIHSMRRTAALLCAAFAGLSLAGPLRAQSPIPAPNPSPAVPTPYSSPNFHSGGAFTPPLFSFPLPAAVPPNIPPFFDPLYTELQGTPTGLVPGTGANAGATVSTEIPSFLLGNYLPTAPPTAPGVFFPNHFRDGTAFSWSAPLTFITPFAVAPASSPTGAQPLINVESTPTAVNVSEFPFIKNAQYIGTTPGSISAADTTLPSGSATVPGLHSGSAPANTPYLIRQLVYFGRAENIAKTTTTGGTTVTTNTPVGAIYCVDGFTGEVVWRFQVPSVVDPKTGAALRDPSVFSAPAVAYMNVLTNSVTGTYANKAVVLVTANDGFIYCLDATGNGDGTSNVTATTGGDASGTGSGGTPIYGAQPAYPSTVSTTAGPHVGTTSVYWIYRPDVNVPNPSTSSSINFDPQTVLPVPGSFGLASPNVYVEHGVSTTPNPTPKPGEPALASNAVIYVGNTRDCVYALDGLGAVNYRKPIVGAAAGPLPAYNASLVPSVTGISDLVPTVNPRWWFTPDNATNNGLSFESTPAIAPPSTPYPAAVVVTSSADPAALGTPVTFKATVSDGTGGGGQPTGAVTFSIDGVPQAPAVPLVAGVAALAPVTFTTVGPHTVTAAYSGDGTFSAAVNAPAFDEEVPAGTAGASTTVITSSLNPSARGQSVTFTATVTDASGSAIPGIPTGTVTFTVDGIAQTPKALDATGKATVAFTFFTTGARTVTAQYNGGGAFSAGSVVSFEQYVFGPLGPTVYIGSSQELGVGSNAGRLYAIDGFNGPRLAGKFGGTGHTYDQRPKWAFPNSYSNSLGAGTPGNPSLLPSRPALGNLTGSPVVFTNTDDVVTAAVGTPGTVGYVPAVYRTRIYFAANSGLEVPSTATTARQPNPRPATDATGRIWAVNPDGSTATTTVGGATTVWSFPEANNPNDPAKDNTAEPSPPIGAFLHSTPAMGFVQFPTVIQYGNTPYNPYTHTDTVNTGIAPATDVKGKTVPMLYVGTMGAADLGFYAIDVNGANDTQRGVYRLESPTGSTFEASPVLVVNSSTTGGNGGAVYATSGNSLLQITATPISNVNSAQGFAFVGVDATFGGGGPISGPAVAAADTSDLGGTQTVNGVTTVAPFTLYGGKNATDFVYFGDGTLGFCRGITPLDANYGGVVSPVTYGGVPDQNKPPQYSNKFFLQAYLFNETNKTSTDMRNALGLNSPITGFEWGGFSYIRIGNVVPPGPFNPASPDPSLLVADPTDPTLFYGNGQTVNFSLGNANVFVPTTRLTTLAGGYPEAGFIHRSDPPAAGATPASPGTDPSTQLVTPAGGTGAGLGWLAVYSYPIGSDQTRIGDTPGAFRRVRQATQTAQIFVKDPTSGTYTDTHQTISLDMQTGVGSQYAATDAAGNKTIKQTPPMEQPTFGILNPLAVQGKGVPLNTAGSAAPPNAAPVIDILGNGGIAGPFGPVTSTTNPTDLAAYANGSNFIPKLPSSGYDVTAENPLNVTQYLSDQTAYAQVPLAIATSVGDILDGTTGDNLDPKTNNYGLLVQNRSLVGTYTPTGSGPNPFSAVPVAMQSVGAHWNDNTDNTTYTAGPPQNQPGGPGATINPLPWEDLNSLSSINANASLDYPDIPASAIMHTLFTHPSGAPVSSSLNTGNGTATLDNTAPPAAQPTYKIDQIKVAVAVPPHQPANLQAWDSAAAIPITPDKIVPASTKYFPHGYIEGTGTGAGNSIGGGTPQRVFVDLSGRGQYNPIYPYRDVQSFAGVPVNMKTTTQTTTVSLENAPSALGNQTENFPSANLGYFEPFDPGYQSFFRPVGVFNDGNVNLLNIHFGQQMALSNAGGTAATPQTLTAVSDGNDLLSELGGFDFYGTSGPINTTSYQRMTAGVAQTLPGTTVPEQSFMFRTSLDTDLMQAYGRHPVIAADPTLNALYPAGTFHKPRAGSAQPTTLTVPDMPETGDPAFTLPTAVVPAVGSVSAPYVGIALPFGTPVGTYHTRKPFPLLVFEGLDAKTASRFEPPTYGGAVGGHAGTSPSNITNLLPLNANNQALVPVSSDGLNLQINVLEDRLTDGYTAGALPMIDGIQAGLTIATPGNPAVAVSTPDFAPAAFRDPASGNMSVFWTSLRGGSYDIYSQNVLFNQNSPGNPGTYFYPSSSTKNWYAPVGKLNRAPGVNSGLSIETGPATSAGAFTPRRAYDVAVTSAPYTNRLYSYEMGPQNGSLFSYLPITPVSNNSQVKYGVKGLNTGGSFANGVDSVWAFWTGTTRGRTALYYSPQSAWNKTAPLALPVPAGLTAVSDASPLLMPVAPLATGFGPAIEVTYSGTGPDGNADLYVSRYVPDAKTATQLDLVPFPPVTENLRQANGWYQGRDAAWSRTGALNISVPIKNPSTGAITYQPLLYDAAGKPLFTKAIYDKASGFLVLTGVQVPTVGASPAQPQFTTNTVTVDGATGRVRFSPALSPATQTFAPIQATFSPVARRLTVDSRADVSPVTFLDTALKANDTPTLSPLEVDRRWTIWRKSGVAGTPSSATLYFKTQRLTAFLPTAVDATKTVTITFNGGASYTGAYDLDNVPAVHDPITGALVYAPSARLYFPIASGAEGAAYTVTYTPVGSATTSTVPVAPATDTVQWQDETLANDTGLPPADTAAGLDAVVDNKVAITTATNENNPAAFLDPLAGLNSSHKVWLFWNSTRNGTADIYSETIDPQFASVAP